MGFFLFFGGGGDIVTDKDIPNATGWRHVGVDTEPNLNLAKP